MEIARMAQLAPENSVAALEAVCPDYRGLHVNLYDLLSRQFSPPKQ